MRLWVNSILILVEVHKRIQYEPCKLCIHRTQLIVQVQADAMGSFIMNAVLCRHDDVKRFMILRFSFALPVCWEICDIWPSAIVSNKIR